MPKSKPETIVLSAEHHAKITKLGKAHGLPASSVMSLVLSVALENEGRLDAMCEQTARWVYVMKRDNAKKRTRAK